LSSILNALKKVETESAAAETVQIRSGRLKLRRGVERHPRRSIGWAILVCAILLLAAGAWLMRHFSKAPVTPPVKSYRIAPAPNHAPAAVQRARAGRRAVVARPAGRSPRARQQAPARRSAKAPAAPVPKRAAVQAPKAKHPPSRPAPATRAPRARPKKGLPPQPQAVFKVSGHGLTLQAIAWDPNPQKRFVVVNSQILHEGQGIDGKVIRQIQREAIIVGQGNANWKIIFR